MCWSAASPGGRGRSRRDEVVRLLPAGVDIVDNPGHAEGMGSSLRLGLLALATMLFNDGKPAGPEIDAALIMLVDLPGVTPAVVRRVCAAAGPPAAARDVLARAAFDGVPGHPVLLGRRHWAGVIESALGDVGARTTSPLIRRSRSNAATSGRARMSIPRTRLADAESIAGAGSHPASGRRPAGATATEFRAVYDSAGRAHRRSAQVGAKSMPTRHFADKELTPMAVPGPGYSITMRIAAPPSATAAGDLTMAVGRAGGVITGFDVVESTAESMVVDISANAQSQAHADELTDAVNELPGVEVRKVSDRTFLVHIGGKIEVTSKVPLRNRDDLSRAYTPGVARVCMAIAKNPG